VTRWAVVLAGGVGSRFWPLSTQDRPKQLLPLVGAEPMLVQQLDRIRPLAESQRMLVLTNASLTDAIARLAPDLPRKNIIAEPKPAGTAAALAWAAQTILERDGKDATMISVHADWAIGDAEKFREALSKAASAAEQHHALVTVGIVPNRPEPGLGHIQPGDSVSHGVRRVTRFVEKPSRERAVVMTNEGYLWNSGIFAWRVGDFLEEVRAHAPEIGEALDKHGKSLDKFFGAIPKPVAVDTAVLEHSKRVLVVPGDFGWDDVGTWGSLHRVRQRDARGNAIQGSVHALDSNNNVVHAEGAGQSVVLYGVDDLVVVVRDGITVVTTRDRSTDLKRLVESLPPDLKDRT
jgi:mannose-1-phosphate guanylyltransferase